MPVRKCLIVAITLAFAGCAAPAPAPPYPPVPPVRAEAVPLPPVSEKPMIYQPGHWDWTANEYRWREGFWVPRNGHGSLWQDGFWSSQNGTWTWIPGHWV